MMQQGLKFSMGLLLLSLVLTGCGRKEVPQVINNNSVIPQISDLRSEVHGNVLRLDFKLVGDERGVGYAIDRTQEDPYCKCPGMWRRFYEQPALARQANEASYRIINLKSGKKEFLFRIRAVDVMGNIGPWSKMIRARAIDLRNQ